jgi:hypothetical protein
MAKNLGYLSIALGIAELVAPRAICRMVGLRGLERLVQVYGAREIATGVAILGSHSPEPWIWTRVAGDVGDMATVASGLQGGKKNRTMFALTALAAVTVLDALCASGLNAEKGNSKTANADYGDRSGFPQGLQSARGAAGAARLH